MDLDTVERTVIKLVNQIRMFDKSGRDGIYAPCDDTVIEAQYYTGSIDRTLNQDGHSTPGSALDNYTDTARPRTCPQLRALGLGLVDPGHRWKGSKVVVAANALTASARADHTQVERQRPEASGETPVETTPQYFIQLSDTRVIFVTPEAHEVSKIYAAKYHSGEDLTNLGCNLHQGSRAYRHDEMAYLRTVHQGINA
ncbi:hypothetical protein E4U61_005523 [Claviceps capensis]|nr:hypothetical protein E4U61_005523 [Claviceps capensis]